MPETTFRIRWPDGREEACYSPSTIVREHLDAGRTYPLAEFLNLARTALRKASDRVGARYGHPCSAAAAQLASIEATARRFDGHPDATVTCLTITGGSP